MHFQKRLERGSRVCMAMFMGVSQDCGATQEKTKKKALAGKLAMKAGINDHLEPGLFIWIIYKGIIGSTESLWRALKMKLMA